MAKTETMCECCKSRPAKTCLYCAGELHADLLEELEDLVQYIKDAGRHHSIIDSASAIIAKYRSITVDSLPEA